MKKITEVVVAKNPEDKRETIRATFYDDGSAKVFSRKHEGKDEKKHEREYEHYTPEEFVAAHRRMDISRTPYSDDGPIDEEEQLD